jgi:hypothetical protein
MLMHDAAADATTATGATPSTDWLTAISNLATQGLSVYAQMQLQNMNMDLIKQGRQPLTSAQMASMAPQLNVGLSSSTQNLLMYGLLGAGAVIVLTSVMKGSRARRRA